MVSIMCKGGGVSCVCIFFVPIWNSYCGVKKEKTTLHCDCGIACAFFTAFVTHPLSCYNRGCLFFFFVSLGSSNCLPLGSPFIPAREEL